MARTKGKRLAQTTAIVFSALVALSMILSLLGPILFRVPEPPTPTPIPTWTPWPTFTPTSVTTATPLPTPTASPPAPTATVTVPVAPTAAPPPPPTSTPLAEGPIAGPPASLVFAVAGDSRGNEAVYGLLLDKVVEDGNAFLIDTGNLVGLGSASNFEAFREMMAGFPLPFYPVPGNHDLDEDQTLTNYLAFSGAPAKHYSFDVEQVHFTMANIASGAMSEAELAWIDADLAATDRPVKMVCTHYPPFDPDGGEHIMLAGNELFMELMAKHGVAYVFAGHIHAYSEQARDGTVYLISGGGGAPLYEDGHPNSFYHYVQVTVEGTQVSTRVARLE